MVSVIAPGLKVAGYAGVLQGDPREAGCSDIPPGCLLESLLTAPADPVRLSPLLQAPLGEILEAVRKLGLEGVVGKECRWVTPKLVCQVAFV